MKNKAYLTMLAGVPVAGGWLLLAAACTNLDDPRDLMMEEATARPIERPVAMSGESTFLAGSLGATATVTRGFERVDPRGKSGPPRVGGPRKEVEETASFQHVYFGGVSEEDEKAAMESYMRQAQGLRAAGSPMPPVTLRVQLENRGTEPVQVEVAEVSSELGNFAPRPASLTIAPGGKGELDPMISQLGVTSDNIPLKLTVRTGGRAETQVVSIKSLITAAGQKQFEELQRQQKKKR